MKINFRILVFIALFSLAACGAPPPPVAIPAADTTALTATLIPATAMQPYLTLTPALPTVTPLMNPTVAMLEGTYNTTITEQDVTKGGLGKGEFCDTGGIYSLTLEGNSWSINQTAAAGCNIRTPTHFNGTFSIAGDQIVFDQVQTDCGGKYTYKWALEGTALKFTLVEDGCSGRVFVYEAHPWVKQ